VSPVGELDDLLLMGESSKKNSHTVHPSTEDHFATNTIKDRKHS
jgi:hypothetical protein